MPEIRRLKSGKWQATVRHPSGKKYSRSDPLKAVVREWALEQERKIRRGEFINPHAGRITLGQWRDQWMETRRVTIATLDREASHWRNHVGPKFASWPLASIQSWDVEAWVTDMETKGVGLPTVGHCLRLLKQMLKAAAKHRLLATNPADGVAATVAEPHVDRVLTRGEAERLLAQYTGSDRVFVMMMLYCGLRFQEAAGLRRFRVDLLRKRIQVAKVQPRKGQEKRPKTDAGVRLIPLTEELVVELSKLIPSPDDGLVFTSTRGGRIWYHSWMTWRWYPALEAAKLADPQPTPHDLRHTFGTWLGEAGVPPNQIAALMGHSSLKSVERYIHATEARFDQARSALERQQSGKAPDLRRTQVFPHEPV